MTRVDFYILSQTDNSAREWLACRLTEKAWRLGHRIYVHCDSETQGQQLDELLWSFRVDAFVPHSALASTLTTGNPEQVQVSWGADPGDHHDVLINLALTVPSFYSRFERVTELVCQQADVLAASRENWKFYQQRGYPLQSHRL